MGKRVRQRDAAKERFWRRAVAEQRRSGLTIREFCSRRSLSEPLFYAWRRELAQRDGRAARKAPPAVPQPQAAPRFVALKVEPAGAAEQAAATVGTAKPVGTAELGAVELAAAAVIEIVTRGGHTLRVPPGVDRQTLAEVWAVLEPQAGAVAPAQRTREGQPC
jgi:transposase-like protein